MYKSRSEARYFAPRRLFTHRPSSLVTLYQMHQSRDPPAASWARPTARFWATSTPLLTSYPSAGCVPAEPASVSPGGETIATTVSRHKVNVTAAGEAGKSVAKKWAFLV